PPSSDWAGDKSWNDVRSWTGELRDDRGSCGDVITHFHKHGGGEGQVYFGSRAEANHSETLAFLQFLPGLGPGDDAARDCTGELPHDDGDARILKRPRHRFVFLRAI